MVETRAAVAAISGCTLANVILMPGPGRSRRLTPCTASHGASAATGSGSLRLSGTVTVTVTHSV
ncbi:MAG: hypothetical protein MKZ95_08090, partial [Pirellulales bacterium]|nr:hypothetical protein [Pirellulales bacterium]